MNSKRAEDSYRREQRQTLSGSHEQIKYCFKTPLTSLVTDHVMAQFTSVENYITEQRRKLWLTGAKSSHFNML